MDAIFEFDQVSYRYKKDRAPALNGIGFAIPAGRKTAIVGPNGAGKSTLILHMNGLLTCDSGAVRFKGEPITKANQGSLVRHVGVMFQDPDDQIVSMTVRDDVAFGPVQLGVPAAEAFRRADRIMLELDIEALAELAPSELSLGQKKQVAIAGVMAMEPEVVIVDEPMAFLDPFGQRRMRELLEMMARQGRTVIVATHNMELVAEWADHVVVVKDGECLASMSPRELFVRRPDLLAAARLELPWAAQLFRDGWDEDPELMPIRLEEAKRWLARRR